jgi:MFS family permease
MTARFWTATSLFSASLYLLLQTLPLVLQAQGRHAGGIGATMALFAAAGVVGRFPVAHLVTRVAPGGLMRVGGILSGAALFPLLLAPGSYAAVIVSRIGQGLALACFNTAVYVAIDRASPSARGRSISHFGLAANGAMAASSLAAGMVFSIGGARVVTALGLVLATGAACAAPVQQTEQPIRLVPTIWGSRAAGASLAMLGLATVYGLLTTLTPVFARGRGVQATWMFLAIYGVSIAFTRIVTAPMLDRVSRRSAVLAGTAALAAALVLLASMPFSGTLTFATASVAFGVGIGLAHPSLMAAIIEAVPVDRRGGSTTMGALAFDLGTAMAPPVLGTVATKHSWPAAFMVALAVLISTTAVAFSMRGTAS